MKAEYQRLISNVNQCFTLFSEQEEFPGYHYHPEYELALVTKGRGTRIIGNHTGDFDLNDLVFIGSYLPHTYKCDSEYYEKGKFIGSALVIQFKKTFLGNKFFSISENENLLNFLDISSRGCNFYGITKENIIEIMLRMEKETATRRLYSLFDIFEIFSKTKQYEILSAPGFYEKFMEDGTGTIGRAIEYILNNFKQEISIDDLLKVTGLSNTAFNILFKSVNRMSFKQYLNLVRIRHASNLLEENQLTISEVAYNSGYSNLSNFNRQFKRIRKVTPKVYRDRVQE